MDKIRIGVFGCRRGGAYVSLMVAEKDDIEVIALCDRDIEKLKAKEYAPDAKCFTDFDEFLEWGKENGMNAMFIANYFHQHAPYAIRAMEAGMDVVSECTSAGTLKECVELVECVERTGRKYMIAENYPFMTYNLKMAQLVKEGKIGTPLFAEGEYNHSATGTAIRNDSQNEWHWRAWLPRTYYCTHAMGPLMYSANCMPKYVSARAAHSPYVYEWREYRHNYDGTAIIFCEMDNGMVARFTGCTAMAADYSRYRMVGDIASIEGGGHIGQNMLRMKWLEHTKPEDEPSPQTFTVSVSEFGEKGAKAANAGHGGGDYWVVQNMIDYFIHDVYPFFDVYAGAAMSAVGILGWKSCLNHGENYKVPDFRSLKDRNEVRDDDLTPFPDENGKGMTLPASVPFYN